MTFQELADVVSNLPDKDSDNEYRRQYVPAYQEFALSLGRRFDALITERNISVPHAIQTAGVTTLKPHPFYRSRNLRKGYSATSFNTAAFCYEIFNFSVNKFLSDEVPTIQLPSTLQLVVKIMAGLELPERKAVLKEISSIKAEVAKEIDLDPWKRPVLIPRLHELLNDKYLTYSNAMGYDNGRNGKSKGPNAIQRALCGAEDDPEQHTLLRGVLFLSLRTGVPIDYFLAMDYTSYADVTCLGDDGEPYRVKDRTTLYTLSLLLSLPPLKQAEIVGGLVTKYRMPWTAIK